MYNPEDHGARCDLCALRLERGLARPVGPENHGSTVTMVGEAPGGREVRHGRPFIGPSGMILGEARDELGLSRASFNYTNALCCKPPKNKLDRVLAKVRARNQKIGAHNAGIREQNKTRRKQGYDPLPLLPKEPTPIECCRPRLMHELENIPHIIPLGKVAIQSINPDHRRGIMKVRGMPQFLRQTSAGLLPFPDGDIKSLPTLHPAYVLRKRRWYGTFAEDLRRAMLLFSGQWDRPEPTGIINPSIAVVAAFLGAEYRGNRWVITKPRPLAFDYETDLLETLDCVVRCIQIGTASEVLVIAFKSVEGATLPYTPGEFDVLKDILRAWFTCPEALKIGHNSNAYDEQVTEAFLGVQSRNHGDNIMAHRLVAGELPHSLGYLGSRYTLVHDWKAGDPGVNARTDQILWRYGILDSSVTAEVAGPLYAEVARLGLGNFAPSIEYSSRLLTAAKDCICKPGTKPEDCTCTGDGRPREGNGWSWRRDRADIPHLHVEVTGKDFYPGIATAEHEADLRALQDNGCPVFHEGLQGLMALDHSIQDAGRDMHTVGMLPDQHMRVKHLDTAAEKLKAAGDALRRVAHEASGTAAWGGTRTKPTPFNPASPVQVRKLLHQVWGLRWDEMTAKTGMLSTGDSAVRKLLAGDLPRQTRQWLLHLRAYRKQHKIVTTYLIPLGLCREGEKPRPTRGWGQSWAGDDGIIEEVQRAETYNWSELDEDDEELEDIDWDKIRDSLHAPPGRSKLRWNGRLHADWKAHRAVTGRISSSPNCFSGDTEVLTHRGWVRFDRYDGTMPLAQWTPGTGDPRQDAGSVEFVAPRALLKKRYAGNLTRLKTRAFDLLVTPKHRCPVFTRKGALEVREAADFVGDRIQPQAGVFDGGSWNPAPEFIQLLCATQADGSVRRWGYGHAITFLFSKQRKQARMDRLAAWAAQQPNTRVVSRRTAGGHRGWCIKGELASALADRLGHDSAVKHPAHVAHKVWGSWLLELTPELLDLFCDEVFFWDGCWTRKNHYSSSIEVNADWVQTILSLRGHRARKRTYEAVSGNANWQVDVTWGKPTTWTTNATIDRLAGPPTDGHVYCVEVPSSFIVVRRNDCVTVSGQCQNIMRWLRKMFKPASQEWLEWVLPQMRQHPGEVNAWAARGVNLHTERPREGHVYVYADADQIELRIAASRWGAARYLEAFARGWDPHQITMHAIWGDKIWSMQGAPPTKADRYFKTFEDGSEFDAARDLGKGVLYASIYGAKVPTVLDMISSAEYIKGPRKGELRYPDLTLRDVRVMQANLLKNCPEFRDGWASEIATLKERGFIYEPVSGRRFDCLDGTDDLSLIVNRPIQGSGAAIIALATADMRSKYPAGFGGVYTGLANHCHDAMTFECPISMAPKLRDDLTQAMCRTVQAYPDVAFVGEAIITPTWK